MTRGVAWGAAALLVLAAPVLMFPAVLGPSALAAVAVFAAVIMVGAIGLVSGFGRLPLYMGVLVAAAIFAGINVSNQPETLNHFADLARSGCWPWSSSCNRGRSGWRPRVSPG